MADQKHYKVTLTALRPEKDGGGTHERSYDFSTDTEQQSVNAAKLRFVSDFNVLEADIVVKQIEVV